MVHRLAWFACAVMVGCSSFDSTSDAAKDGSNADGGTSGPSGSLTGESGPTLRIGVDPTTVTVIQGASVDVTLSLVRSGGLAGPVAFTVTGAKPGATVTAVTAQDSDTSVKLTIQAEATAQQGHATLTIHGTNDATKIFAETTLDLLVRGPSGSLDTTFADGGKLELEGRFVSKLVPRADGKLVILGNTLVPQGFVMRVDELGAPDPTFTGGTVETPFTAQNYDAVVYDDGGMLIIGAVRPYLGNSYTGLAVMKLTAAGAYDPAFNSDQNKPGRHTVEPEGSVHAAVRGKDAYVLVGAAPPYLAKLDDRGTFASGFGTSGKVTFAQPYAFGLVSPESSDLVLRDLGGTNTWRVDSSGHVSSPINTTELNSVYTSSPDGKLVGGKTYGGGLFRLKANSSALDPSFGQAGKYTAVDANDVIDVAYYLGGKLYTAGPGGISRRLDNGSPDTSFAGGLAKLATTPDASLSVLALQPDGRLLVSVRTDRSIVYRIWQ